MQKVGQEAASSEKSYLFLALFKCVTSYLKLWNIPGLVGLFQDD